MKKNKFEDELDFKKLLKSPLRLFGFNQVVFIILLLAIGIFYVRNLDVISFNSQPVLEVDSTQLFKDIEFQKGGFVPAIDLGTVSNPTEKLISKGRELYNVNCSSCHGETGDGVGAASAALNPKPRNFLVADDWTNGHDFSSIYKTLQEGIISNGMAPYEYLPIEDRFAIIHFIQTLGDFYSKPSPEEIKSIDEIYKLSAGVNTPNRIPVTRAMELYSEQDSVLKSKISIIKNEIVSDKAYEASLIKASCSNIELLIGKLLTSDLTASTDKFISVIKNDPPAFGFKGTVNFYKFNELDEIVKYLNEKISN